MSNPRPPRLSPEERAQLLERLTHRAVPANNPPPRAGLVRQHRDDLTNLPFHQQMQVMRSASATLGIVDPYFRVHEARAGAQTIIDGRVYDNFSSYDYLGLNGRAEVAEAAKAAIDRYGTSPSASRLVAGERPLHQALEQRLAAFHGVEACLTFVSGHATNVTVIGHLLRAGDLIIHDELIHNSVLQGAQLSGARRFGFAHNDVLAAENLLSTHGKSGGRILIVIEGHYSMDGDLPDLRGFVDLARRHQAWLLVDEAHALGVIGKTGRGVAEHFGVDPADVDLWMGTLSKTLAGCGGYLAGRREMIEYLKFSAPGFVYSVGMSPPLAAAALAALDILQREPERVQQLNARARAFLEGARAGGLDTGRSEGFAIVPIVTGSSIKAARLSEALFQRSINVQPILYPAVPERSARLRFFLSAEHSQEQIERAVQVLVEEAATIKAQNVDLGALVKTLSESNPS
jgi:8-amino-7-oxononanoate synthase